MTPIEGKIISEIDRGCGLKFPNGGNGSFSKKFSIL